MRIVILVLLPKKKTITKCIGQCIRWLLFRFLYLIFYSIETVAFVFFPHFMKENKKQRINFKIDFFLHIFIHIMFQLNLFSFVNKIFSGLQSNKFIHEIEMHLVMKNCVMAFSVQCFLWNNQDEYDYPILNFMINHENQIKGHFSTFVLSIVPKILFCYGDGGTIKIIASSHNIFNTCDHDSNEKNHLFVSIM